MDKKVSSLAKQRPLGLYRGQLSIPEDFNAPLPDDIQKCFDGGELMMHKITSVMLFFLNKKTNLSHR
jgi:hypothetical protein